MGFNRNFARSAGQSRFPGLWRGLVGAWVPRLGPTGLILHDISPYKNHGTLTSMDPGTDWIVSEGRLVLDFDGTNDEIIIADHNALGFGIGNFSVSVWVKLPFSGASYWDGIVTKKHNVTKGSMVNGWGLNRNSNDTDRIQYSEVTDDGLTRNSLASSNLTDGWHYIVLTRTSGVNFVMFIDGKSIETGSIGAAATLTNTESLLFGNQVNGRYLETAIGDVLIYNGRSLSPSDVLQLYIDPLAPFKLVDRPVGFVAAAVDLPYQPHYQRSPILAS